MNKDTSTAKKLTKGELEREARRITDLARDNQWELLLKILSSDFPEELAEFMLEGIKVYKTEQEDLLDCSKARHFKHIMNIRHTDYSLFAPTNVKLFALGLMGSTRSTSKYRKLLQRIANLDVCFQGEVAAGLAIRWLNLALAVVTGLKKLTLVMEKEKITFNNLLLPENLKQVELVASEIAINFADVELLKARNTCLHIDESFLLRLNQPLLACLLAEKRDLNFLSLTLLSPQEASALSKCAGRLTFGELEIKGDILAELSGHSSFQVADKNQVWQCDSKMNVETPKRKVDDFLILGEKVVDCTSGKTCLDFSSGENERFGFGQGHAFTVNGASEVECVRLKGGKTIWKQKVKDANKAVFVGDVLIFSDYASLSKHNLRDGSLLSKLSLGLTAGGSCNNGGFTMAHFCHGERLFLWSPNTKYTGGRWLVAVNLKGFAVEWQADFPVSIGRQIVWDELRNELLLCAGQKLYRLDPATGAKIGKPVILGGGQGWPHKCYKEGSVIVSCQKGYDVPQLQCYEQGNKTWTLSLSEKSERGYPSYAAYFQDLILLLFTDIGVVWIIDRKTGTIQKKVKQDKFEIGRWQSIACFDDRYVLLCGESMAALYDGLPSSWI